MRAQSMQEVCKRKRGSKRQRGDDDDDDDERVMDRDSAPPRTEGRKYKRKKKYILVQALTQPRRCEVGGDTQAVGFYGERERQTQRRPSRG